MPIINAKQILRFCSYGQHSLISFFEVYKNKKKTKRYPSNKHGALNQSGVMSLPVRFKQAYMSMTFVYRDTISSSFLFDLF